MHLFLHPSFNNYRHVYFSHEKSWNLAEDEQRRILLIVYFNLTHRFWNFLSFYNKKIKSLHYFLLTTSRYVPILGISLLSISILQTCIISSSLSSLSSNSSEDEDELSSKIGKNNTAFWSFIFPCCVRCMFTSEV